jgi:hypothetical protein
MAIIRLPAQLLIVVDHPRGAQLDIDHPYKAESTEATDNGFHYLTTAHPLSVHQGSDMLKPISPQPSNLRSSTSCSRHTTQRTEEEKKRNCNAQV